MKQCSPCAPCFQVAPACPRGPVSPYYLPGLARFRDALKGSPPPVFPSQRHKYVLTAYQSVRMICRNKYERHRPTGPGPIRPLWQTWTRDMADKSKIEWTETTWNPVTGCSQISTGCQNCYAERYASRLKAMGVGKYCDGFAVKTHQNEVSRPLSWKGRRLVFVNSMGDLFHDEVPLSFIQSIFSVMARASNHIFQILTKRGRQASWTSPLSSNGLITFGWASQWRLLTTLTGSKTSNPQAPR